MALALGTKERLHQPRLLGGKVPHGGQAIARHPEWADAHIPPRRVEMRMNETKACTYHLCEPIDQDQVSILHGEAYCVNRSGRGILVMMGDQPRAGQLLEVRLRESQWRYSASVYEVRWMKPLSIESQGDLYLVGCRLLFRPAPYWKF